MESLPSLPGEDRKDCEEVEQHSAAVSPGLPTVPLVLASSHRSHGAARLGDKRKEGNTLPFSSVH